MLVSDVLDRTFSEWLNPAGIDRPAWDTVATQGTALSVLTDGNFTTTGRIAIPNDSIVEIDDELIRLTTFTTAGNLATTLGRGYLETDPATHAVGAQVTVDPLFPRKVLFNALVNIVQMLYPNGLYQRVTASTFNWNTQQVQALDAGTLDVLTLIVRSPSSYENYTDPLMEGRDYRINWAFDPPKISMIRGGYENQPVTCIIKKDFVAPASTSDDLTATCGIPVSLQPSLSMAVAGWVLQGREVPRVQIEDVRRSMAAQGVQIGAALNVGQALLKQFWDVAVANERKRMFEKDPTRISVRKTG